MICNKKNLSTLASSQESSIIVNYPKERENKMKIGVVSFYNNGNFGSSLQAYALQETLKDMGYEPFYITIKERGVKKLLHVFGLIIDLAFRCMLETGMIKHFFEMRRIDKSKPVLDNVTKEKVNQFVKKNINSIVLNRSELNKIAHSDDFIAFICGSDQIWSPLLVNFAPYRFLSFSPKKKRIAYAPSFGVNKMPSFNTKRVMKKISEISYLSIREENGKDEIKKWTGLDAEVVLDPTLLVTREFWDEKIEHVSVSEVEANGYVFCYFLSEPTKEIVECIKRYADYNKKLISFVPYANDFVKENGAKHLLCDPLDFVRLVKDANAIFTDSFHGVVFSVIYAKPFLAFERKHSQNIKQTSRLLSLLRKLDLEERFIADCSMDTGDLQKINRSGFSHAQKILQLQRVISMSFLSYALGEVQKPEIKRSTT